MGGGAVGGNAPRGADGLARALVDAREYTRRMYAHLTPEEQAFPRIPIVNLPRWEVGHVGWFQEFWCRRYRPDDPQGARMPSRIREADAWWDSRHVPHATRWTLPVPGWDGIHAYLDATLADTLAALAASRDGERYFFELALYHEDMHVEALLMTLQTLALPLPPWYPRGGARSVAVVPTDAGDVEFAGGAFAPGAAPGDERTRFVFDNEKWRHDVVVPPFALARRCVTNAEFAAFVEAGGYARRAWWTDAGWRWREQAGATHPAHWRRDGRRWWRRRFDAWTPLPTDEPVVHVNAHEAEAWCRFAGRRLPTEAEWEFAAVHAGPVDGANLDHRAGGPVAADDGGDGLAHLFGNVWEWTASAFAPYPGFAADPYAEYSAPWFGDHRVIRGGSFATRSRLVHARFRNFYLPERRDMFVGFRTCATSDRCASQVRAARVRPRGA